MEIEISKICLDNRDDIIFLFYVLETNDMKGYKQFCHLEKNRKVKFGKIFTIYNSIKKNGQKNPIKLTTIDNKIYPISGAHRLASLIKMGATKVKARMYPKKHSTEWNHNKTINSHHFKYLNQELLIRFSEFKEKMRARWSS